MKLTKHKTQRPTSGTRLLELDGIRAIAILLVIGCHFKGFSTLAGGLPSLGWIGVDVFFVLSGFLITSILLEMRHRPSALKHFYIRRVLRIFPVYFVMLAIISIASLWKREGLVHFGYFVNRGLFLQSLVDSPSLFKRVYEVIVGHLPMPTFFQRTPLPFSVPGATLDNWGNSLAAAWSLSIEEYFYFIWAPTVLFLKKKSSIYLAAVILLCSSIMLRYLGFDGQDVYFVFLCRMDVLMAGSLLALGLKWGGFAQFGRRSGRTLASLMLVGAAGFCAVLFAIRPFVGRETRDSLTFQIFGLTALGLFITGFIGWVIEKSGSNSVLCRILRIGPLRYIGVISYCMYLVHIPIYYSCTLLAIHYRWAGRSADLTVSFASLAFTIVTASLSWKYFEGPILSLKEKLAPSRPLAKSMPDVLPGHLTRSPNAVSQ